VRLIVHIPQADALQLRFRKILGQIVETKQSMGQVMRDASLSYAQAVFLAGDFGRPIIENVGSAQLRIRSKADNVAGVKIPVFETFLEGTTPFEYTGLGKGGQQIQRCKEVRPACLVSAQKLVFTVNVTLYLV
jgi:V-type H+-transporting ATPase subunit D